MKCLIPAALLPLVLAAAVVAQETQDIGAPAQPPPPDYEARQFVDSRGCVYVRAGLDGNVTWVPQLTRDRQPVCGQTPTFPPEPAPERVEAAADPAPTTARPAPAPTTARPAPAPQRTAAPRPAGAAAAPARSAAPRTQAGARPRTPLPAPPAGYRHVWEDDRLNPDRGKQTLTGALQTALVWTQTVPRRLVDRTSGADMTERLHYLIYPYTDHDRQLADLRAGTHVIARDSRGQRMVIKRPDLHRIEPTLAQQGVRVTTRAAAQAIPPAHVEVGTFATEADARRVAEQLAARGLTARLGRRSGGNPEHRVVLVGPFTDAAARDTALATVRGLGYTGARLR